MTTQNFEIGDRIYDFSDWPAAIIVIGHPNREGYFPCVPLPLDVDSDHVDHSTKLYTHDQLNSIAGHHKSMAPHYAFADELTHEMNVIELQNDTGISWSWYYPREGSLDLISNRDHMINLASPNANRANMYRVSGYYPDRLSKNFAYDTPSIKCSTKKTPKQIARDIHNRFLGDFYPKYDESVLRKSAHDTREDVESHAIKSFEAATGGTWENHINAVSFQGPEYWDRISNISYHNGKCTFSLEISRIPFEHFELVADFIKQIKEKPKNK